jgi:hypothetical protein
LTTVDFVSTLVLALIFVIAWVLTAYPHVQSWRLGAARAFNRMNKPHLARRGGNAEPARAQHRSVTSIDGQKSSNLAPDETNLTIGVQSRNENGGFAPVVSDDRAHLRTVYGRSAK